MNHDSADQSECRRIARELRVRGKEFAASLLVLAGSFILIEHLIGAPLPTALRWCYILGIAVNLVAMLRNQVRMIRVTDRIRPARR